MSATLLEVRDLKTHFRLEGSLLSRVRPVLKAVDGVSFTISSGEVLGLVGESGCGKSTVGRSLTRLETVTSGAAYLDGVDILQLSPAGFRRLRANIQMIFQDPFASLNPRLTIQQTLAEPLRIHGLARTNAEARSQIAKMLSRVGMAPDAMARYPFEFSGGQRQRICIARVMILLPRIVIADEPVSALDVSIQAQVLKLIREIQSDSGVSMLFISHDLGVVRQICDRVAVMYLGRIVETAAKAEIFTRPSHPYTRLLLDSIPRADPARRRAKPVSPGETASATNPPTGCAFHPRCPLASDICRKQAPAIVPLREGHEVACHHAGPEAVAT